MIKYILHLRELQPTRDNFPNLSRERNDAFQAAKLFKPEKNQCRPSGEPQAKMCEAARLPSLRN